MKESILIKLGWKTDGLYWWFEDSEKMSYFDAIQLMLDINTTNEYR